MTIYAVVATWQPDGTEPFYKARIEADNPQLALKAARNRCSELIKEQFAKGQRPRDKVSYLVAVYRPGYVVGDESLAAENVTITPVTNAGDSPDVSALEDDPTARTPSVIDLVVEWLRSDRALLEEAILQVTGDEFEWGDNQLAMWVGDLLYDPSYRRSREDLEFVAWVGADVGAARNLRDRISQDEFDEIDWSVVRERLIAE